LLSTHVERIHNLGLEGIVGEHDGIKREIGMLRNMIDQRKLDMEMENNPQSHKRAEEDEDDDNRSVATIQAGEQYSDEELDDENDEERRRRRDELGRPRTPEPSMGMDDSDGEGDIGMRGIGRRGPRGTIRRGWDNNETGAPEISYASRESVERLTDRLEQLAAQFESALELSRELQAKQVASQEQIASLQAKVDELEASKELSAPASSPESTVPNGESAAPSVSNLVELTKNLEGRWERHREEWQDERERLKAAKEEWERRVRRVEEDISGVREVAATASATAAQANSIATISAKELAALAAEFRSEGPLNGVDQSEFAPPSPRSISSDVLRSDKRKRSSVRRRSRSSSLSPSRNPPNGHAVNDDEGVQPYSPTSMNSVPYSGNGKPIDSQINGKNGRLLSADSRTDSMSSSSAISTPERKPDIVSVSLDPPNSDTDSPYQPLPYLSAVATLTVALIGVAAWTAANHIHA
jgi:chemotaxis protein histidine kinase CheA